MVSAFYVVVLAAILVDMLIVRESTAPYLATGNYIQLIWKAAKWIFWTILITGIVVGPFPAFVASIVFDRKVRQKNINDHHFPKKHK